MKTQINFRDFRGFDHLREYVQDTIEKTIGKFGLEHLDINVTVGTDHARRDGHAPHFLCEAILKGRSQRLFVKKIDADFQLAVKRCMKALNSLLVKQSTIRRHQKRRPLLQYGF